MYIFAITFGDTIQFKNLKTVNTDIKIKPVFFRNEIVFFSLEGGCEIGAPLEWYLSLNKASKEELVDFSISSGGYGVHWNGVDEYLSAYEMLNHNHEKNTLSL